MTPDQLCKSGSEHGEQRALFAWVRWAEQYGFDAANDDESYSGAMAWCAKIDAKAVRMFSPVPELRWCHAIPNGGSRGDDSKSRAIQGGKLKAEGVLTGILDVFLPLPMPGRFAGLYIEMKREQTTKAGMRKATIIDRAAGSTSAVQDEFIAYARGVGYAVSVCFDWRSAARDIQSYVEAVRESRR